VGPRSGAMELGHISSRTPPEGACGAAVLQAPAILTLRRHAGCASACLRHDPLPPPPPVLCTRAPLHRTGLCVYARTRSSHIMHAGRRPPLRDDRVDRLGHHGDGDGGATTSSRCRTADTLPRALGSALLAGVPSMPHTHYHAMRATQHARTRPPLSLGLRRRDGHLLHVVGSSCASHLGVWRALRARRP